MSEGINNWRKSEIEQCLELVKFDAKVIYKYKRKSPRVYHFPSFAQIVFGLFVLLLHFCRFLSAVSTILLFVDFVQLNFYCLLLPH